AFPFLAAGAAHIQIGADHRQERIDVAQFCKGGATRDVTAAFLELRVPIVRSLTAHAGARHDRYSDSASVTSNQYWLTWRPHRSLKMHAGFGECFRPLSLYEIRLQRMSLPVPILDPKTN